MPSLNISGRLVDVNGARPALVLPYDDVRQAIMIRVPESGGEAGRNRSEDFVRLSRVRALTRSERQQRTEEEEKGAESRHGEGMREGGSCWT